MRKIIFFILLGCTLFPAYGQWQGSNDIDGDIYRNGNVGIGGTPRSVSKLTIKGLSSPYPDNKVLYIETNGESSIFRDQIFISSNLPTGYGIAFAGQGHHRAGIYAENYGGTESFVGRLTLWARGNSGTIIFDAGKVGIGTTETGTHRLAVEGTIGAREIKVEADSWSDFVFDDNYKLKGLEEVESFINENNHLPDIPSENEVLKNGIQLGEMNAKLLQKIEELTLYMIEQNKKTEKLIEKVDKLESENELLKNEINILKTQ